MSQSSIMESLAWSQGEVRFSGSSDLASDFVTCSSIGDGDNNAAIPTLPKPDLDQVSFSTVRGEKKDWEAKE